MSDKGKVGAVAVVGAGIGGMQSALDLAESGFKVYLIDSAPAIGGNMARLDKTFPTNDCAMCTMSPKLVDCGRHLNIEILTYSDVESIKGEPGNFKLKLKKKARLVDLKKCTGCEECVPVCPVEMPFEFDAELARRKAIYRLYPQAIPNVFVIDKKGVSPCKFTCPAGVNAHGYIALISQGKFKGALELERADNPFPSVCGRVCTHPCEKECTRKDVDEPVSIRTLKRFIADYEMRNPKSEILNKSEIPIPNSQFPKVAIVGAGPAGLTAAFHLIKVGYPVTVFETLPKAGGMLRYGIPEYRLPSLALDYDIDYIKSLGVEIKLNTPVDNLEKLKDYKSIFVSIGAQKNSRLNIDGEDLPGVIPALTFLKDIKLEKKTNLGDRIAVIGGGNTAIDAARSALRLGAKEVFILYRRSKQEMPADPAEIEEGELEGVKIQFLVSPKKIIAEQGKVKALECQKMELGAPDKSGRRRPIPIAGSEFTIELDTIIPAIGQTPDAANLSKELNLTKWGTIVTDDLTKETNLKGVFAGGDVSLGAATVIEAIAAGKEAAISIDRYLRGVDLKQGREKGKKVKEVNKEGIPKKDRLKIKTIPLKEREKNFAEVELCPNEEEAVLEAKRCLNCSICSECRECEKVCGPKAIDHNMKEEFVEIDLGVVILTPGYELFDPKLKGEYGFGRYKNVISSIQFERMLSSSGPSRGEVYRPSDKKHPKKIAFIQCVGSRDSTCGNDYCSAVCCMYSTKEAIIAKEHLSEIEPTIFFIDLRAFGKDFEKYYERAQNEYGVRYVRSNISKIIEDPKSQNLILKYINEKGELKSEEFDLVILAIGLMQKKTTELSKKLGIDLNQFNFSKPQSFAPGKTNQEAIFVGGTFAEPKDIPETVIDGSLSASYASEFLSNERGKLTKTKRYPREVDVSIQAIRLGIIICRCGRNIASVVDVPSVVEYAKTLSDVVYADEFIYSCSADSLENLKEKIKEHQLNRVVVASCTPRTHAPIFQDTVREAGLNPALFEFVSIREQVSWVHMNEKEEATKKAKSLVAMGAAKARLLKPIKKGSFDVNKNALVIGAGLAGLSAANAIAGQGYEVALIEKEKKLGGNLLDIFVSHEGDPQELLQKTIQRAESNPLIKIHKNSTLKEISGYVGNFKSKILNSKQETEIEHGIIIIAAGGAEYVPKEKEYGFGHQAVITQRELGKKIKEALSYKDVVMIQCVGSRDDEHPWCSRNCCTQAITHAIKLKEKNPEVNIYILYRDIRSFGFKELLYKEAREKGVLFIRYEEDKKPEVQTDGNKISVKFRDLLISEEITIEPDLLVLSTGMMPSPSNEALAKILKVPLNTDKFFLEKHAKIAPLDFSAEGIFMAGLSHSPRSITETIAQARAAAIRAATVLSKKTLEARPEIVEVREKLCVGCGLCIEACPYDARYLDEDTHKAKIKEVLCQGCGACCAACPNKASRQKGFSIKQINTMIEA